jgi:magnesium-transporting ATPase (P-type)
MGEKETSYILNSNGNRHMELFLPPDRVIFIDIACLCQLGRAIEFTEAEYKQFRRVMQVDTIATHHHSLADVEEYHYEIPSMTSAVITESAPSTSSSFQIFSEGSMELILESCTDYWNGAGLGTMNELVEKKIFEFCRNAIIMDLEVVAFAYRPVQNSRYHSQIKKLIRSEPYFVNLPPNVPVPLSIPVRIVNEPLSDSPLEQTPITKDELPSHPTEKKIKRRKYRDRMNSKLDSEDSTLGDMGIFTEITKGQTFLGAASFEYLPKPNMIDFVEDLALAGIRFVYFSRAPERESKAYAERLGLEIDWNSCIILSPDDGSGKGYLAIHDMKAQLPRGIENIRNHITNVDDVPLHVSLFAECKPYSIREMIKIFQEYGEIVCCIGSSLNDLNIESFGTADTSIALDPIPISRTKSSKGLSPLAVSASFNASMCALTLNHDVSLYSVTQMIREARSLAENGKQAFGFYIGTQIALSSVILLSYCALVPVIFTGYQIMFVLWITFPILSLSILFTPHLPDIMTHLPGKNADHWKDVPRFMVYYFVRFVLIPSLASIGIFWLY